MGSSFGKCDFKGLEKLRKQIEQLDDKRNEFMEACAKELASRLLAKVIKRTPVGDYSKEIKVTAKRDGKKHKKGEVYTKRINPSGKVGGTLRRGWTTQAEGSGTEGLKSPNARAYVDTLKVKQFGGTYVIEITNPIEYASYVEYGHRTKSGKGWVEGHFMLTISEQEIQTIAPRILEDKLKKLLEEHFR